MTDLPAPLASIQRRLQDIKTYQLDRLRSAKDTATQNEWAGEVRGDVDVCRRGIEDAEMWIEEDRANEVWRDELERCRADLARTRTLYREALVHSSASIRNAARHELLPPSASATASASSSSIQRRRQADAGDDTKRRDRDDGDELQTKTNEVTDALRRTTQLMRIELDKSVMATQMLDESSQTLRSTHTLYDTYSTLLTTSASLVRAIENADWYDRLIIFAALAFFLLCVGWIVKRRVLDRVAGGVGWWVGGSWRLITGQWRTVDKGAAGVGAVKEAAKGAMHAATDGVGLKAGKVVKEAGQAIASHGASGMREAVEQVVSSAAPSAIRHASMGIDAVRQQRDL